MNGEIVSDPKVEGSLGEAGLREGLEEAEGRLVDGVIQVVGAEGGMDVELGEGQLAHQQAREELIARLNEGAQFIGGKLQLLGHDLMGEPFMVGELAGSAKGLKGVEVVFCEGTEVRDEVDHGNLAEVHLHQEVLAGLLPRGLEGRGVCRQGRIGEALELVHQGDLLAGEEVRREALQVRGEVAGLVGGLGGGELQLLVGVHELAGVEGALSHGAGEERVEFVGELSVIYGHRLYSTKSWRVYTKYCG